MGTSQLGQDKRSQHFCSAPGLTSGSEYLQETATDTCKLLLQILGSLSLVINMIDGFMHIPEIAEALTAAS